VRLILDDRRNDAHQFGQSFQSGGEFLSLLDRGAPSGQVVCNVVQVPLHRPQKRR
jgi:hypothetical protein